MGEGQERQPMHQHGGMDRLETGGRIQRDRPITVYFDGHPLPAFEGDTLASALLANGQKVVARSFKFHRPRGVFGAGVEEPNALVQAGAGAWREPNTQATMIAAFDGLQCSSQNAWPNVRWDGGAVNQLGGPFLKAGFYYKTFIGPRAATRLGAGAGTRFWMACERVIRKAAGMGTAPSRPDPDGYEKVVAYCDVLIVGAGPAGLAAAIEAAQGGAEVLLIEQDSQLGGCLLSEPVGRAGDRVLQALVDEVRQHENIKILTRTSVFGAYDCGVFGAVERVTDHKPRAGVRNKPRQRFWQVRARQGILATGAIERSLVFGGNDKPGVMLASALRAYLNRYAVLPAREGVILTTNDSAYLCAADLARAGAKVVVCDVRPQGPEGLADEVRRWGGEVLAGYGVTAVKGVRGVQSVVAEPVDAGGRVTGPGRVIPCRVVGVSGGWSPTLHLWSQRGGKPVYDDKRHCFVPDSARFSDLRCVGGAAGDGDLRQTICAGAGAARLAVDALSDDAQANDAYPNDAHLNDAQETKTQASETTSLPRDAASGHDFSTEVLAARNDNERNRAEATEQHYAVRDATQTIQTTEPAPAFAFASTPVFASIMREITEDAGQGAWQANWAIASAPVWAVQRCKGGVARSAFVDLQHDVTWADIALAFREGYVSVEHLKRYTTTGMAADQGKLSNVPALARMAALRQIDIGAAGTTTFRPPFAPVTIGAIAGRKTGHHFHPTRLSALHEWHQARGAKFIEAGLWLRPWYYPEKGEGLGDAYKREAAHVRAHCGMVDVSTLGKIMVQGPDALAFLNRIYANSFTTLKVGRLRYGVMLRDDGFVFDDGTVARLSETDFLVTTTTAHAGPVLAQMEFLLQTAWQDLRVTVTSVTDEWAAMALAGPKARAVLQAVVGSGVDVSNEALPQNAFVDARINRVAVRVHRMSFSGELAYEIFAPSGQAISVWEAVMVAGEHHQIKPYGVEAMGTLRIEKGHVSAPELDGRTTLRDLNLGGMAKKKQPYVGSVLSQRPLLLDPSRPSLVGLEIEGDMGARSGALLFGMNAEISGHGEGHVTSTTYSPALGKNIALGMLMNGQSRIGERIKIVDLMGAQELIARVVSQHFYDQQGERQNG